MNSRRLRWTALMVSSLGCALLVVAACETAPDERAVYRGPIEAQPAPAPQPPPAPPDVPSSISLRIPEDQSASRGTDFSEYSQKAPNTQPVPKVALVPPRASRPNSIQRVERRGE
jgi:hypothetical protein